MTSTAIQAFLDAAAVDPSLQQQCKSVATLKELAQSARAAGFGVTVRDLQLWVHHEAFDAALWPWSGAGRQVRLAFFRG